jgi:hypothetical protein
MQITVEIPDELAAQVQARGLAPKSYIEGLIADQAALLEARGSLPDSSSDLSPDDFNASLDALARYSNKIPSLPIEAFTRESFYQDRE